MTFEIFCVVLFALLFGLISTFGGYRLFVFLLPIWGFFIGFGLGAQSLQIIFGIGFISTVTSWVAGFLLGTIFAVLSYLFYTGAVALASGALGYGLVVGAAQALGFNLNLVLWLVGIIGGLVLAFIVIRFNIQKYAVIAYTAVTGTSAILFTLLAALGGLTPESLAGNPVQYAVENSFLWLLLFLALVIFGIGVQILANRRYEVADFNMLTS